MDNLFEFEYNGILMEAKLISNDKHKPTIEKDIEKLPNKSGVYMLIKGKQVLYIGKSTNIYQRVKNHKNNILNNSIVNPKEFELIIYWLIYDEISEFETNLIKLIPSKYNGSCNWFCNSPEYQEWKKTNGDTLDSLD